ncbi:extracellular solute-binding protein [Candidatus Phytoplasma fraxini]|uniref:extracellular solute-binding protein n=1 Tax=Ash yellows phytoplasma TaxID=35780 RepID=UPI0030FE954E
MLCNLISGYNEEQNKKQISNFKPTKSDLDYYNNLFKKENADVTKINFWHNLYPEERKILKEIISEFKKDYPGIEVLEDNKGYWKQIFKSVNSALTVNKQPNLVVSYPDHIGFYHKSDKALSLDEFIKTDKEFEKETQDQPFFDGYFDTITTDDDKQGRYYLPFLKTTEIMFYNKDLLKKVYEHYNNDRGDDTFQDFKTIVDNEGKIIKHTSLTWDEMDTICKQLKKYKTKDFVPILVDSESNLFIISTKQKEIIYPDNKEKVREFLEDSRTKDIIKYFHQFSKKDYLTLSKLTGEDNIQKIIKDENIAFYITSTRKIDSLCTIDGFVPDFTSIPTFDKEKNIIQGSNINLFFSTDKKENYASWFFLKKLISYDVYAKFLENNKLFNITRDYFKYTDSSKNEIIHKKNEFINKIKDRIEHSNYPPKLKQLRQNFFENFILNNNQQRRQDFFITTVFEKSDFFRNIITDLFLEILPKTDIDDDTELDSQIAQELQIAIKRIIAN